MANHYDTEVRNERAVYHKVGRRYVPVGESVGWDHFPLGSYLVTVHEGQRSARRLNTTTKQLSPDYVNAAAVLHALEPELLKFVGEAMRSRPMDKPLTKAQHDAWRAFERAMGETLVLRGPSAGDVVDALFDAINTHVKMTEDK